MAGGPSSWVQTGNPYFAEVLFSVTAGGLTTEVPPEHLLSFSYTITIGGAGRMVLRVLDQSMGNLEALMAASDGVGTVTFGYTKGGVVANSGVSPNQLTVPIQLYNYELDWTPMGTELTIYGYHTGGAGVPTDTINDLSRDRTWVAVDGITPLLIEQIIQEMCTENGWNSVVETTVPVLVYDSNRPLPYQKTFRQIKMTDQKFCSRVLRLYARSAVNNNADGTPMGGYQVYFDSTTTPPTLHFHTMNFLVGGGTPRTYKNYTYDDLHGSSTVIDWKPQVPGAVNLHQGHLVMTHEIADHYSKVWDRDDRHIADVYGGASAADPYILSKTTHITWEGSTERSSRTKVHKTDLAADNLTLLGENLFHTASDMQWQAIIKVLGDPSLPIAAYINVYAITPAGPPHYSSGIWKMIQIEHNISGGNFTSEMTLIRWNPLPLAPANGPPAGPGTGVNPRLGGALINPTQE